MKKILLVIFMFAFIIFMSVSYIFAEVITENNIEITKKQDTSKQVEGVCYAGKLVWDGNKWRRQIVIYNNSKYPTEAEYPELFDYVRKLPPMTKPGSEKWEPYHWSGFPCK